MMHKTISPARVEGRLRPPSSKSYAQRAIAAALLSPGQTIVRGLEMCDDTRSALAVAQLLGAFIEPSEEDATLKNGGSPCTKSNNTDTLTAEPNAPDYIITGGLNPCSGTLDIGESGLAARLFTPLAALCATPITITGRGTIMGRTMEMMTDPMRRLGVRVDDNGGYLPITVCGPLAGGDAVVDGSVSSQFLTGLLMALPLAARDTSLHVTGLAGTPYIDMTLDLARTFGVRIEHDGYDEFFVPARQQYACDEYHVEGDWSGASCLLVAGAIAGNVTLENLNMLSLQADTGIIQALERAGARIVTSPGSVTVERAELNAFEFDAKHCPDLFPALVALAANCHGTSVIRGRQRLIHKESNRASALTDVFGRMGLDIDLRDPDAMRITGGKLRGATVESHRDHRIAMAAAVAALAASSPVRILGAESVNKSYPRFWEDLSKITQTR